MEVERNLMSYENQSNGITIIYALIERLPFPSHNVLVAIPILSKDNINDVTNTH